MARNGGGTQYQEITPGVGAPQVAMPGSPVRTDPAVARVGWQGLASFGGGISEYAGKMQRAIDLNAAVEGNAKIRQGAANIHSQFEQTVTGDKLPGDVLKDFTAEMNILRDNVLADAKTPAQKNALLKSFDETMNVYAPKTLDSAHRALLKKTDINLRDEIGGLTSASYDALARQDPNFTEIANGNAELVKRAVLARVGLGVGQGLSPLDADAKIEKFTQAYWGGLVHTSIGNPETFPNTMDAWNSNRPIYEGKSLRQLVDPATIPAVEGFLQKTFEVTTNKENAFWDKQIRLQEKAQRDADRTMEKQERVLRTALDNTKEGQEAKAEIKRFVGNDMVLQKQLEGRVVDAYVANGGRQGIIDVTLQTLYPKRSVDAPRDFTGDPNNPKEMDRYGQHLVRQAKTGADPAELARKVEWYERNRPGSDYSRKYSVNPPR